MRIKYDDYPSDDSQLPKFGYAVWLDERRVHYVQSADDVAGEVTAPLIDDHGKPIFDPNADDYVIVTLRGSVILRPISDLADHGPRDLGVEARESPFNVRRNVGFI